MDWEDIYGELSKKHNLSLRYLKDPGMLAQDLNFCIEHKALKPDDFERLLEEIGKDLLEEDRNLLPYLMKENPNISTPVTFYVEIKFKEIGLEQEIITPGENERLKDALYGGISSRNIRRISKKALDSISDPDLIQGN